MNKEEIIERILYLKRAQLKFKVSQSDNLLKNKSCCELLDIEDYYQNKVDIKIKGTFQ